MLDVVRELNKEARVFELQRPGGEGKVGEGRGGSTGGSGRPLKTLALPWVG